MYLYLIGPPSSLPTPEGVNTKSHRIVALVSFPRYVVSPGGAD